jgi:ATP-dependent exoDNAse (exonuclease V) alpha subunit
VLGDKVMQTRNTRMKGYPRDTGLDYVANGEIGVAIGR